MALLSQTKRNKYLKALGFESVKDFQKKAFTRSKDIDGVYGKDTDNALRHFYNVYKYTKNFEPEEFKCGCGGKYCTGYPTYMKSVQLANLQTIRTHFGKMTVTCGLRCKKYNNSLKGSASNSKHLTGYATDFYIKGATDTLAHRKSTIKFLKKLPNHNYSYGNGINSSGAYVSASNMGNCMHIDSKKGEVSTSPKGYTGTLPTLTKTVKSNDECINKMEAFAEKIAKDNSYIYVKYTSDEKTHQCPICHPELKGKYKGCNCIKYVGMILKHGGGVKVKCTGSGLLNNDFAQYDNLTLAKWKERNGNDWELVAKQNSEIPASKLKKGDVVICYSGKTYKHVCWYAGDGYIYDATSGSTQISKRKYSSLGTTPKIAFRYTGQKKSVKKTVSLKVGSEGDNVRYWQKFLNWYFGKTVCPVDGIFGNTTSNYTSKFQNETLGKTYVSGKVDTKTLEKAKAVKK